MCANRKQDIKRILGIAAIFVSASPFALAETPSAGGVALGEAQGGITDRAYVTAPPNYHYVVERARGSFIDCGEGLDAGQTDEAGRDLTGLTCGVTLTETIVIPAASSSAKLIVHY